ncbi:MAG: hypothetical protein Q7S95_04195 [bacterium]|nr:hypothetical protein [bacterium]
MTDGREAKRAGRTSELIAHEAARFIKENAGTESLITVTRATTLGTGTRAVVYVSVFPEDRETSALAFLARGREAFSDHLKAHVRVRPLPRVTFEIDHGEKHRRRLDELGSQ